MGNRIQALAQPLLGKASIEECSVEEVKHLAQRHPYFAPAQFLLLQKLKDVGADEAEAQQQKAVLYYPDPLQFDYFISADNFQTEKDLISVTETGQRDEIIETLGENATPYNVDVSLHDPISEEDILTAEEVAVENESALQSNTEVSINEENVQQDEIVIQNKFIADDEKIDKTDTHHSDQSDAEFPVLQNENVPATEVENKFEEADQHLPVGDKPLAIQSETVTSKDFVFEPYYTVDYFASQGIKTVAEELPKDTLGKGLKSFTEWLKTMKRLPSAQLSIATETLAEKNVETMANSSVSSSEIVTETMAEVWAKQGNREKAIDIYNKLSLLHPSKKAFFAGKIENLKTS